MLNLKSKLTDYTESEFFRFLQEFYEDTDTNALPDDEFDDYISTLAKHFTEVVNHPKGNALIFHPSTCGINDSSEAVIQELKRWYTEQGLPCFKD
ncbi:bacteriocin immunity protein [Vibrio gazogenes]|uniref:Colicin immunity protein / pyocin immunity protein n=1 Tax=Vibrio gazogenes DSM 21264 = NBRC 103151 TaxID=1123492 RepID=A0A1M5HP11_VIBGA|nr:bacteriocin immunity protein [Vibrio gazogenes]USP12767.1 bacteriocin immunity protein [Vibrio gazogenes]SHG17562.1 Colicin immunity protein / pyocin immunity protein [Vibrio gazogenes DSM 21264] [Vibrio gazogenes DSM 21264 = NBRC 103151]SJN57529.1 Colicin-E7 immunity protein [Vibrio gazogenes]